MDGVKGGHVIRVIDTREVHHALDARGVEEKQRRLFGPSPREGPQRRCPSCGKWWIDSRSYVQLLHLAFSKEEIDLNLCKRCDSMGA